jgi:hypothetical protein
MRRTCSVGIAFTLLLLLTPASLHATAIVLADGRYLQGRFFNGVTTVTNMAFPSSPFSLFNQSLQTFGFATQNSTIDVVLGSMTGFSGTLTADTESNLFSDYSSLFDITFSLDTAYEYSINVDFTSHLGGASNLYSLSLNGSSTNTLVFSQNGFPGNEDFSFYQSGLLGPGDYQFRLLVNAFHTDRNFPVSSDIAADFSFDLTSPTRTLVPEGEFALWPGAALAAMFLALKRSRMTAKRCRS